MENNQTVKVKKPVNKDTLIIALVIIGILLLTAGIVAYYFWGVNSQVLVTYTGGKITRGEYEAVYRYWAPQLVYYGYDSDTISEIIVDEILLNEVIYNEATAKDYVISEEDKKTTDEQFADADSIAALRSNGINPDYLKTFFYKNAVVSDYLEDIKKATTTEELKLSILATEGEGADLNLYKTRHILIATDDTMSEDDKAAAKKEAEELLAKVKKGEDMAELAKNNSDDSGTAYNGGAFDMVNNTTVDEDYRKAATSLKAGKVYDKVVESDFGYFVIKLESIEKDGRLTSDSDIEAYVNEYVDSTILTVFDRESEAKKKELAKAKGVADKLNAELGIASASEEE